MHHRIVSSTCKHDQREFWVYSLKINISVYSANVEHRIGVTLRIDELNDSGMCCSCTDATSQIAMTGSITTNILQAELTVMYLWKKHACNPFFWKKA